MRIKRTVLQVSVTVLLLFPLTGCSEQKFVENSAPTGNTKWDEIWKYNPGWNEKCKLEEWKIEWSDGSIEYEWKKTSCRALTDFERAQQNADSQPDPNDPIPTISPAQRPSNGNSSRYVTHTDVQTFEAGTMSCYRITTTYYSDGTQTKVPSGC